jgi:hypothetical protein
MGSFCLSGLSREIHQLSSGHLKLRFSEPPEPTCTCCRRPACAGRPGAAQGSPMRFARRSSRANSAVGVLAMIIYRPKASNVTSRPHERLTRRMSPAWCIQALGAAWRRRHTLRRTAVRRPSAAAIVATWPGTSSVSSGSHRQADNLRFEKLVLAAAQRHPLVGV